MSEQTQTNEAEGEKHDVVSPDDNVSQEQSEDEKKTVSFDDHHRALEDMKKYKAKVRELEDKINKRDDEELRKQQKWQELAEIKEREAISAKEEAEQLKRSIVFSTKYGAVKEAALKSGIRNEALSDLELLDFDDVEIETTSTGRHNVLGADKFVERLKSLKPHWFSSKRGRINSNEPEVVSGGEITYDQLLKAEEKAQKSGDYSEYQKLLLKFQQQQRK